MSYAVNVGVGTEDNDGIPVGQVAEDPNDDDEPMEEADEPPLLVDPSDDDAGPAAPYEPESESDDDEDGGVVPTAKRAHDGGAEPTAKRARELHALQQLLASATVKRILKELEECAELKLPADRSRQAPRAASQWSSDCAEVYSPPRITVAASRMGLKPAWALDLTTLDEASNPWDFS